MKPGNVVRIKIGLEKLRAHALSRVDEHYNNLAHEDLHLDHEYAHKRDEARRHLAGERSTHIEREAAMRGVDADDLAVVIAAKPNTILERGHERRGHVANVNKAATLSEIEAILAALGLKLNRDDQAI